MTPLMLAAARNKASICKLLLDAGADYTLTDSTGRDAHAIAVEAGSVEAAAIIGSVRPATAEPHDPASPEAPAGTGESPSQEEAFDDDGFEFDMSDWKAEVERPPPEADPSVSEAVIAIQTAISEFELIDRSADWGDLEAYLPERASPLPNEGDAEWRRRLRLMLLRALREGSVPAMAAEDLSNDAGDAARGDVITILTMVLNDLGAELDERFEYSTPFDDFEVDVNPEEAPDEEDEVDDALAFVGDLTSYRNEPLRIYQREIQREKLLSAEQEVELAQAMENSVQRALDALASWPEGIGRTLDAARAVKSGEKLYPATTSQTCIVHLIRNSLDYASWKDRKLLAAAIKPIYTATSAEAAQAELDAFEQGPWGQKFPTVAAAWRRAWDRVMPTSLPGGDINRVQK